MKIGTCLQSKHNTITTLSIWTYAANTMQCSRMATSSSSCHLVTTVGTECMFSRSCGTYLIVTSHVCSTACRPTTLLFNLESHKSHNDRYKRTLCVMQSFDDRQRWDTFRRFNSCELMALHLSETAAQHLDSSVAIAEASVNPITNFAMTGAT